MFHRKVLVILAFLYAINNVQSFESTKQAKLIVKQHPSYQVYDYSSQNPLKMSDFREILLAINGFSINQVGDLDDFKYKICHGFYS